MASRRQPLPRIIDKRRTDSGTEYLISTTGEWVQSSTSRCIHPELVELYEWLHNSGFRAGTTHFASIAQPKVFTAKGARKRLQSPSSPTPNTLGNTTATSQSETPVEETSDEHAGSSGFEADKIDSGQEDVSILPKPKKPRLQKDPSYLEGLSQLSIDKADTTRNADSEDKAVADSLSKSPKASELFMNGPSVSTPIRTSIETLALKDTESHPIEKSKEKQEVMPFNRNTEQMIEVYFKEGLEFIAAFFYAVVLSPLTEPGTIEAAIHVLDRTLTLHGSEPFQHIWDVQKRRREFADGTSPFSKQSCTSTSESSSAGSGAGGMSTRSRGGNGGGMLSQSNGASSADIPDMVTAPVPTGRLPGWNSIRDLIKAELGLDLKEDSKQHIALQEYHIRLRLRGEDHHHEPSSGRTISKIEIQNSTSKVVSENESASDKSKGGEAAGGIREEQEIRDEVGRAIVGFLLRVLEQDAVLKDLSTTSFFCKDVLQLNSFSPTQAIRDTLDVVFQIVGLATSSAYLEPPTQFSASSPTTQKGPAPWPLNERCKLNATGSQILQLGQQLLLLLIRFVQSGSVLQGKGLEELVREVSSRLMKVNRDRKLPSSCSPASSTASSRTAAAASATTIPFLLERYNLDQIEVFLKMLIQGPCLLDPGTGSGAGVKLRHDDAQHHSQQTGDDINNDPFSADTYGIFKSQTGICMGSSSFVTVLVDHWFRTNTTARGAGAGGVNAQLNFRKVVEEYTQPSRVRTAIAPPTTSVTQHVTVSKGTNRRSGRNQVGPKGKSIGSEEDQELQLMSVEGALLTTNEDENLERWNAKDLEQVEWTVMMVEVLVWSWIESRGIRRDELIGTGLEYVLFPEESSQKEHHNSGWLEMKELLDTIGGTLKTRWDYLESVVEIAVMIEDLCLR
ncbi:hypothetical protein BG011_004100 [Mortierella polycephala]|uniref:Uncharacterized protein n=1 Tax=Mortierella polycephala TaxID=41804 RepID=A0A9P6U356_9FUNG|nr:hypothetical protein BG011_004100 [Mortierella polycephala]